MIKKYESYILELRDKPTYKIMRGYFQNTPEYVFRELFYAHNGFFKKEFVKLLNKDEDEIEDVFSDWIDLDWNKKIITVNISDFNTDTQKLIKKRKMGNAEISNVPKDLERMKTQKELSIEREGGLNEPVILLETEDGYDLLEGWHRTMNILSLGSDGSNNYKKWNKVKLNAWIGR